MTPSTPITFGRRLYSVRVGELTVTTLAGFYDQSHFANAFRRTFGATPSQYRRRAARTAGFQDREGDTS